MGGTSVDDPARAGRSGAALEGRARSAHLAGDYAATIELYERAYRAYRREGDLLCAARAARTVSWFRGWIYGEWAVANGWMARTRGLLDQAGDNTQERGWVLLAEAQAGDDLEQQRRLYRVVIELAERYQDADLECEARSRLGVMLVLSGFVDEGMVELDESLAAVCGGDVEDLSIVEGIFSVEELLVEGDTVVGIRARTKGGTRHDEHARVVIGADGVHSLVARAVRAPTYRDVPARQAKYYSYWSGMPTGGEFQAYVRPTRALVAIPTHDDLTCVVVGWPIDEFDSNRHDVEGNYLKAFDAAPAFVERMRHASRVERLVGTTMAGFYRTPHGPGWALVGDAGYHKDACTAQGITDAFHHAELLADALDAAFTGRQSYDDALACYRRTRDDTTGPMYQLTADFASFDAPPPEMQQLLAAVAGDCQASADFVSVQAGTMPVTEFFDPANLARYLDGADIARAS